MKCVQTKDGKIARVSDEEAARLVKAGASYISKKAWRAFVTVEWWREGPIVELERCRARFIDPPS